MLEDFLNKEAQTGRDCGDGNNEDDTIERDSKKRSDTFH